MLGTGYTVGMFGVTRLRDAVIIGQVGTSSFFNWFFFIWRGDRSKIVTAVRVDFQRLSRAGLSRSVFLSYKI